MIYLDSSAVVKLAHVEAESDALADWLASASTALLTSALAEVEVPRALARAGEPDALDRAAIALAGLAVVEMTADVRRAAARLRDPGLRSLDAVHVASAVLLGRALAAFVTYDVRQATAVARHLGGVPLVSPGVTRESATSSRPADAPGGLAASVTLSRHLIRGKDVL